MKCFEWCSKDFSTSCLMVKIMSEQPRPSQKPQCDSRSSSSASFCSLAWVIVATTFQPPPAGQCHASCHRPWGLFFLGMVIWVASAHSLGTCLSSRTECTRSRRMFRKLSSSHVTFTISDPAAESSWRRAPGVRCRQEGLSDCELLAKVAETTSTVNTHRKVMKTFRECEAHHSKP